MNRFIDSPYRHVMEEDMTSSYLCEDELCADIYDNAILNPSGKVTLSQQPTDIDECAVFLGFWLPIWGHCITDNLRTLWYLRTQEYQQLKSKEGNNLRLYYSLRRGNTKKSLPENFFQLLEMVGIDRASLVLLEQPKAFRKVVVPQFSEGMRRGRHFYCKEYKALIDSIRLQIPVDNSVPERIYFSRTNFAGRQDFGEKYIEEAFRVLGYRIYYPEQLTLMQQLVLLNNCKQFAATEGSVAHNALFCKDGTDVVIVRKSILRCSYQFMINDLRKLHCTYIDSHLTLFKVFEVWSGPFFMYANDNLVQYVTDNGGHIEKNFPRWQFLLYTCECMWRFLRYRLRPKMIEDWRFYLERLKRE